MNLRRAVAAFVALLSLGASAQIVKLAELNTEQVRALDRSHTVVLFTDGIMEEHGPYLPSYTDGYLDEAMAQALAQRLVERPGWTVAMFPVIPLGTTPANEIGGKYTFPSSYTVRHTTVRDVYMDLADAFGKLGFRYLFIIDSHGGPLQSVALDTASDYFHDTYGGEMTHLLGTMRVQNCCEPMKEMLTKEQVAENGMSVHADAMEQSFGMFLRPDLVPAAVKSAKPNGSPDFPGMMATASKPDWPGYLGSPAYASAALGARAFRELNDATATLAFEILDGKTDPRKLERYGAMMMEMTAAIQKGSLGNEAQQTAAHERWLAAHPKPAGKL